MIKCNNVIAVSISDRGVSEGIIGIGIFFGILNFDGGNLDFGKSGGEDHAISY